MEKSTIGKSLRVLTASSLLLAAMVLWVVPAWAIPPSDVATPFGVPGVNIGDALVLIEARITALEAENGTQQTQIKFLGDALAAENAARLAAELALQAYIDAEALTRQNEDAATLAASNAHSDSRDLLTLADANAHSDSRDVLTLAAANAQSDSGDAATLTAAQLYADTLIAAIPGVDPDLAALANVMGVVNGDVVINGANLRIQNGLGDTQYINGKGNLIIGYDEANEDKLNANGEFDMAGGTPTPDEKSGSHNLVIGRNHTYTSFAGLIAGANNRITQRYAAILGGESNLVNSPGSTISGGSYNIVSNHDATISGGSNNRASGFGSSISGGKNNTASAGYSSVSGGSGNHSAGWASSISGGSLNQAIGTSSSVQGGQHNSSDGGDSSINGGYWNITGGLFSTVSGGAYRSAYGEKSWAAGSLFEIE